MKLNPKHPAFNEISREFSETFGYIRQDIAAIRRSNLGLNYTTVLLICCACQMLAWHKDLEDHEVFTSLFPDGEPYRSIGKKVFEAVRNGLAHRFRPNTLDIRNEHWRFRISWQVGPPVSISRGDVNWIELNAQWFENRVIAWINAYEEELRQNECARSNFIAKFRKDSIEKVPDSAEKILNGLNAF